MAMLADKHASGLADTTTASICNVPASAALRAGLRLLRDAAGAHNGSGSEAEAQIAAHRPGLGDLADKLAAFHRLVQQRTSSISEQLVEVAQQGKQAPLLSEAGLKAVHVARRRMGASLLSGRFCPRAHAYIAQNGLRLRATT